MIAAVFAALPQELKHIRKDAAVAVQTGMGAASAESSFQNVVRELRPDLVLSVGFGGALYDNAAIGDILWSSGAFYFGDGKEFQPCRSEGDLFPGREFSRQLGELLQERTGAREGNIFTVREMIPKTDIKRSIPSDMQFPVCDMETYFLAEFAHRHHIPFLALRSISDRLHDNIPAEFLAVANERGQYRFSNAFALLLTKPRLILSGIRLGKNAAKASRSLGDAVNA
jgi:nucleoside phosphorylase